MRAVEHEHVRTRVNERAAAVEHVRRHADGRRAQQPSRRVLGGVGVLEHLFNVLYRDKPLEAVIPVDYGQLLNAVFLEDGLRLVKRRAFKPGDEVVFRHDLVYAAGHIGLKLHVAVGDDADEPSVRVDYGHAGNAELRHERIRVAEGVVRAEGERVGDNAVFRALDHVHLFRLRVDAHVLVYDADAALARNGDRHAVLRHSVHRRAHHRHVQPDALCELRGEIDIRREHIALRRDEQHVVKRQTLADKTL